MLLFQHQLILSYHHLITIPFPPFIFPSSSCFLHCRITLLPHLLCLILLFLHCLVFSFLSIFAISSHYTQSFPPSVHFPLSSPFPVSASTHLVFIHIVTFLTSSSSVAGQTKTHKGVDLIDAGSSILARIRLAVVNVWGRKGERKREGGVRCCTKRTHTLSKHLLFKLPATACYWTNPWEIKTFGEIRGVSVKVIIKANWLNFISERFGMHWSAWC